MVRIAALLLLSLLATPLHAVDLKGIVIDREHGTPIADALVVVQATHRTQSDGSGRFRLDGLPQETLEILIEHIGYEPWARVIEPGRREIVEVTARIRPVVRTLEPVEVSTTRPDPSVPQGKRRMSSMQVRRAAGSVATDLLRVVQALPGVAAAGDDFSNRFVVRGGDPEENLVLVDGYQLLQPIHLEGFTSVVYDDVVQTIDVYPGALPPRYGDALSSVTALSLVDPAFTQKFFRYDLSSIALGFQVNRDRLAAVGAGRASFYNLILRRPPGVDKRSFQDFSTRVRYAGKKATASITAVASRDREEGDFDRSVDAALLGIRLTGTRGTGTWRADLSYASRMRTVQTYRPVSKTRADLQRVSSTGGFLQEFGPRLQARIDLEARLERFEDTEDHYDDAGGVLAAEGTWTSPHLAVSAGGRLEKIVFSDGIALSPYLSARLRGLGRFVPGAGWRIVRQSPFHLFDNPEVAGLPVDPGTILRVGRDRVESLAADHFSASCEVVLERGFEGRIEFYEKGYRNLLTWAGDVPTIDTIGNDGTGYARGLEISLRRSVGRRLTGWLSYSLSKSRKREGASSRTRPGDHDRPSMFQGALEAPIRGGTSIALAYRAASGRVITPLERGEGGVLVPGEINSERLPSYQRLDLKIEHRIDGKKTSAFLYLDILNLANRKNTVDVVQFVGAGGEITRIYNEGVRILPVAGFGFYF